MSTLHKNHDKNETEMKKKHLNICFLKRDEKKIARKTLYFNVFMYIKLSK